MRRVGSALGAGDEVRTRDVQLGRLTLYQLSYSRGRGGRAYPWATAPATEKNGSSTECPGSAWPVLSRRPRRQWWVLDSNQRRRMPAGLQPAPFGHSGNPPVSRGNLGKLNGCSAMERRSEAMTGEDWGAGDRSERGGHWELARGIEPPTAGLQNRCSAGLSYASRRTPKSPVARRGERPRQGERWSGRAPFTANRSMVALQRRGVRQVACAGRREMGTPHPRPRWLATRASNRGLVGGDPKRRPGGGSFGTRRCQARSVPQPASSIVAGMRGVSDQPGLPAVGRLVLALAG